MAEYFGSNFGRNREDKVDDHLEFFKLGFVCAKLGYLALEVADASLHLRNAKAEFGASGHRVADADNGQCAQHHSKLASDVKQALGMTSSAQLSRAAPERERSDRIPLVELSQVDGVTLLLRATSLLSGFLPTPLIITEDNPLASIASLGTREISESATTAATIG
ncbi:hypothetical protein C8F01DRAFT_1237056 [Mycena amicta]|nr:hypothetical protein C8F01DRAFT_1237056 [Mycena amicta]